MTLRNMLAIGAALLTAITLAFAGTSITQTIHVFGNCNSCKKRIEKPLKSLDGVEKASWDKDTKQLTVTFDPEKVSEVIIRKAVAEAGYDTDSLRATNESYSKLPKCCKYRDGDHEEE